MSMNFPKSFPQKSLRPYIAAGELRTQCTLQKYTRTILPSGNVQETWTPVDTLYAAPVALFGMRLYYADQLVPGVNAQLKIRYRTDVTVGSRLVTDTHTYTVMREPIDPDHRHAILLLDCQQLQVTAP
jgi:SPP1 family predicted phage head-tail adaptor